MIEDEGPRRKIQPQDGGGGCRTAHAEEAGGGCPGGRYWDSYASAMAEGARVSAGLGAADSVLNHSAKSIEIEDIEVPVAELERAAEASKPVNSRSNR